MSIKHFAVALALILVDPRQRRIVQHAVLTVATFHLQRCVNHRFAAAGVDKGSTVDMRRLRAQRVEALPRLPCQHQQRQQDQHEG